MRNQCPVEADLNRYLESLEEPGGESEEEVLGKIIDYIAKADGHALDAVGCEATLKTVSAFHDTFSSALIQSLEYADSDKEAVSDRLLGTVLRKLVTEYLAGAIDNECQL